MEQVFNLFSARDQTQASNEQVKNLFHFLSDHALTTAQSPLHRTAADVPPPTAANTSATARGAVFRHGGADGDLERAVEHGFQGAWARASRAVGAGGDECGGVHLAVVCRCLGGSKNGSGAADALAGLSHLHHAGADLHGAAVEAERWRGFDRRADPGAGGAAGLERGEQHRVFAASECEAPVRTAAGLRDVWMDVRVLDREFCAAQR